MKNRIGGMEGGCSIGGKRHYEMSGLKNFRITVTVRVRALRDDCGYLIYRGSAKVKQSGGIDEGRMNGIDGNGREKDSEG